MERSSLERTVSGGRLDIYRAAGFGLHCLECTSKTRYLPRGQPRITY